MMWEWSDSLLLLQTSKSYISETEKAIKTCELLTSKN